MRSRFAPSPTGFLHWGHAYSACCAYAWAGNQPRSFVLRIEDIDRQRCRVAYVGALEEDLRWLGIDWHHAPWVQSQRLDDYQKALQRLQHAGVLYPCFCTRKQIVAEVTRSLHAPNGHHQGLPYPGTCRRLSASDRERRLVDGENHAWRLDVARALTLVAQPLRFYECGTGWIDAMPEAQGDIVLARKDCMTSYALACVMDDAAQGIEIVVRGEDLKPMTHTQRLLQALLNLPTPRYAHHRLLTDDSGVRLAKSAGSKSLRAAREDGVKAGDVMAWCQRQMRAEPWFSYL